MQLANRLVLITGASSGIGAALAQSMARRGARLILVGRNVERLRQVANGLPPSGAVEMRGADLARPAEVASLVEAVLAQHGPPDVLVNNAGAGRWLTVAETSAEELQAITAVPYLAAFNLTRGLLPAMRQRGSGQIVAVTSVASRLVWPAAAYTAARAALLAFADCLRTELHGTGLRVTVGVFGTVATAYWEHNPGSEERLPLAARSIRGTQGVAAKHDASYEMQEA